MNCYKDSNVHEVLHKSRKIVSIWPKNGLFYVHEVLHKIFSKILFY